MLGLKHKQSTQQQSQCDQVSLKDSSLKGQIWAAFFFFKQKMLAQLHHVCNLRVAQVIL